MLSVAVTSAAARLALVRPSMEHLTLETRSRLVADYSADALAMRLEPLDPDVVRAAAQDESSLAGGPTDSNTALPPAAKVEITPESTRIAPPPTAVPPTATPEARPTAATSPVPTAKSVSPTSTRPPADTSTPLPTASSTPRSTSTPGLDSPPTSTLEAKPTSTSEPEPTATPTLDSDAETATQKLVDDLAALVSAEGCAGDCSELGDKVEDALSKAQTALSALQNSPPDAEDAIGTLQGAAGDLEAALGLDPAQDTTIQGLLEDTDAIIRMLHTS